MFKSIKFLSSFAMISFFLFQGCATRISKLNLLSSEPYHLTGPVESRSISFENVSGEKGAGGKAASRLGIGRKGAASKSILPGETIALCDVAGSGTIRHIWMTGSFNREKDLTQGKFSLRTTVIRAFWDGQKEPSIECPIGDFMGVSHAKPVSYQSAVHSIGENGALNIWLPMPFKKSAKITLTNEAKEPITLYYQIDYTIHDRHPKNVGRLHACFLRDNPTRLMHDFEILPKRNGRGRFIGTVIGVRSLNEFWWGEGEVKMYLDGDTDFPTVCGTGTEDYICLSYGVQKSTFLYHGCNFISKNGNFEYVSLYRWHIQDPVFWKRDCRITIQQIGMYPKEIRDAKGYGKHERQDDWCAATFWYESIPSAPLPPFPGIKDRIADLVPNG